MTTTKRASCESAQVLVHHQTPPGSLARPARWVCAIVLTLCLSVMVPVLAPVTLVPSLAAAHASAVTRAYTSPTLANTFNSPCGGVLSGCD